MCGGKNRLCYVMATGGVYYKGTVVSVKPAPLPSAAQRELEAYDPWEAVRVEWDASRGHAVGECENVSPWELQLDPEDAARIAEDERRQQEAAARAARADTARLGTKAFPRHGPCWICATIQCSLYALASSIMQSILDTSVAVAAAGAAKGRIGWRLGATRATRSGSPRATPRSPLAAASGAPPARSALLGGKLRSLIAAPQSCQRCGQGTICRHPSEKVIHVWLPQEANSAVASLQVMSPVPSKLMLLCPTCLVNDSSDSHRTCWTACSR